MQSRRRCHERRHSSTEGDLLPRAWNLVAPAAAAVACAILPAASASASLIETSACDGAELSQPFAAFGDSAYYKLVPGGNFESGLSGWSVSGGAKVVSGGISTGHSALSLPAGASVTTPVSCVNAGAPSFRFFSKSSGGLLGLLP